MTPIEIEILLHYRYRPSDFRDGDFSAPAVRNAIERFLTLGLLEPWAEEDRSYRLGSRGEAYVNALCAMPLPVRQWVANGQVYGENGEKVAP